MMSAYGRSILNNMHFPSKTIKLDASPIQISR